jgi:thioredoxin reductase
VSVIDSVLWYKNFTIIYADFEAGFMFTPEELRHAKIFACLDEAERARLAHTIADVRLEPGSTRLSAHRTRPHYLETRSSPFPLETSLPGVFCAGDARHNSIKRVSSGVGEGSMAIAFIHQYLAL